MCFLFLIIFYLVDLYFQTHNRYEVPAWKKCPAIVTTFGGRKDSLAQILYLYLSCFCWSEINNLEPGAKIRMHSPRARLVALTTQNTIWVFPEKTGGRDRTPSQLTSSWQGICEEIQVHINAVYRLLGMFHTQALCTHPFETAGMVVSLAAALHVVRKSKPTLKKTNNFTLSDNWGLVSWSKSKHELIPGGSMSFPGTRKFSRYLD